MQAQGLSFHQGDKALQVPLGQYGAQEGQVVVGLFKPALGIGMSLHQLVAQAAADLLLPLVDQKDGIPIPPEDRGHLKGIFDSVEVGTLWETGMFAPEHQVPHYAPGGTSRTQTDRKSTRLNSS